MNTDSYEPETSVSTRQLLGPIRQIGFVVADVEDAARDWTGRFGIGPWRIKHGIRFTGLRYGDRPIDIEVSIATSYSERSEVKLVAQTEGPASMYSDHLTEQGPGAQHVCFYPSDYTAACHLFATSGATLVMRGMIGDREFSYFDDGHGQVVELVDIEAAALTARGERIEAARHWDGSDPIQVVS